MLIQSIPAVADINDPVEKKTLVKLAYRLSRALIGNRIADQFQFPKTSTLGTLWSYRMKQRLQRFLKSNQILRSENFSQLLKISVYDDQGLSYRMPNHPHSKINRLVKMLKAVVQPTSNGTRFRLVTGNRDSAIRGNEGICSWQCR